ncbi:putative 39S ribosomal protein L49, mitochondrial [Hypsibius exemplaris]|uniref:Large ribosomal subunit protein mL49 n=1 Tax=Hypsibius exemplaris TaxID=2072580 RepID=A0A1W0X2I3_HYPEX|nr:putative 39S ribosomal protein L49, mitochondrial [Hypsibius exemplaris]
MLPLRLLRSAPSHPPTHSHSHRIFQPSSSLLLSFQRTYLGRTDKFKPPDPNQTYTPVVESADEFRFVDRLLGRDVVPKIPEKSLKEYPTPSGWIPPAPVPPQLPYFIARTRFHNLPVYLHVVEHSTRKLTQVAKVQGDIWMLEKELVHFLRQHAFDGLVASQVSEVNRWIRIKGNYVEQVKEFLLAKGF